MGLPFPAEDVPLSGPVETLILSCYESGHQPLAAASTLAFLRRAGRRAAVLDLAVEPIERLADIEGVERFRLIAVSVPMHTALRVGVRAAAVARRIAPGAHLCFYGLYATLNAEYLLAGVADSVIGGEFEQPLVELAAALERGRPLREVAALWLAGRPAGPHLARLDFPPPLRESLPAPDRYARLEIEGEARLAAAVETSRGCLHVCRHCPITPVYGGRFFIVPREVVLEDIRRLASSGVRHITFADPDFLNGPGHSVAIVRAMHEEHPEMTFDFTTKIEHVLRFREKLEELAVCGCLFVVSAVESLSDEVLGRLLKGHTRADVEEALGVLREAGIAMRPSFVAFTPWTRIGDYLDVLDWVADDDLIDHVDPVQFSIRLLVPPGSALLDLDAMRPHLRGLEPENFSHRWQHPDPRMDRLQREISSIVRGAADNGEDNTVTFERVRHAARLSAGLTSSRGPSRGLPARVRSRPPRLTEPWFC